MSAIAQPARARLRAPVVWGLVVGLAQAATPLAFWWLDTATVYALGLAAIASIYIGFANNHRVDRLARAAALSAD